MYISLLVGATTYPLAGEVGVSERVHSPAADLRIEPQAEQQLISRLRATTATVVDRGNLANTITFTTTRKFLTPALAAAYALMVETSIPRSGTLIMQAPGEGGWLSEYRMAGAVIAPPRRNTSGATVFLEYSITGGAITEITAPPSGILLLDDSGIPVLTDTGTYIYLDA